MLAALPTLTTKERAVLAGVLNDKSQQQLADEQRTTRKAVSTALRRARHKLAVPDTLAAVATLHALHSSSRCGQ